MDVKSTRIPTWISLGPHNFMVTALGFVCEVALSVGGPVPGKFLGIVGQDPSDS